MLVNWIKGLQQGIHQALEDGEFAMSTQNSPVNVKTIFYSDIEHLSNYSLVILHLSPATKILYETPTCSLNLLIDYKSDKHHISPYNITT